MTELTIFPTAADLGAALAGTIADGISAAAARGQRYVLGCPGGRSPRPVYTALAAEIGARNIDLDHVIIVMMDDYAVADGDGYRTVPDTETFSVARFGVEEIVTPLQAVGRGTPTLWTIDAADPMAHETRIAATGIDLFILASGSGDGHVAFNAPGTLADARSRVVELPLSTRTDNVRTHPEFGSPDGAPQFGATIGTGTIAQYSRKAVLVAHGAEKKQAADTLRAGNHYNPDWPATIVHLCQDAELLIDGAAAA